MPLWMISSASPTCRASALLSGQSSRGQSGPSIRANMSRCLSCISNCLSRKMVNSSMAFVLKFLVSRARRFLAFARSVNNEAPQNFSRRSSSFRWSRGFTINRLYSFSMRETIA